MAHRFGILKKKIKLVLLIVFSNLLSSILLYSQEFKNNNITGNSDNMTGTVSVAVFFVESNGAIDPNIYNWTVQDEDYVIQEINNGLNFWTTEATKYGKSVSFNVIPYRSSDSRCQQSWEPILRGSWEKGNWIGAIMTNFGYSSGSYTSKVTSFNTNLKTTNGTNWAFSVFVCYNPAPANTSFIDGFSMTWNSDRSLISLLFRNETSSSLGEIFAHNVGHIFEGAEESGDCVLSLRIKSVTNGNCEKIDGAVNTKSVDCIMKNKSYGSSVCTYTAAHIGWISSPFKQTITSNPSGLQITTTKTGNGTQTNTTPADFPFPPASTIQISTMTPQIKSATTYDFSNWSDSGNITHEIIIPNTARTITAKFNALIPPNAPNLVSPLNDSLDADIDIIFFWTKVSNATSYRFQLSTNQSFTNIIYDIANISDTNYTILNLNSFTNYYWRVSASNSIGTSSFSSYRVFKTTVLPPQLISPGNNSIDISINPIFSWSSVSGFSYYHLRISSDSNFSSSVVNNDQITTNSYNANNLSKNVKFFWKVRTISQLSYSAWSEIRNFKTIATTGNISLSTENISFETTGFLDNEKKAILTIINNSSLDEVVISSIYFDEDDKTFETIEKPIITIPPNSNKNITIQFNPNSVGFFSKTLHIINSSNNLQNAIVFVSGNVAGSKISSNISELSYGDLGYLSESKSLIVRIQNDSSVKFKISDINLLTEDSCFEIVTPIPSSGKILSSKEYFDIQIKLNPNILGLKSNKLMISNNSSNFPQLIIDLIGNIRYPDTRILSNNLIFDNINESNPSNTGSVVFTNLGSQRINITQTYLSDDTCNFKIIKDLSYLESNSTDSIQIEFKPLTSGTKLSFLNICTTDTLFKCAKIQLIGNTGGKPTINITSNEINYGVVDISTTKDTFLIVKNTGNLNLIIDSIVISEMNKKCFLIKQKPRSVLSYNEFDTIKISFSASLPVENKKSKIFIYTNDTLNKIIKIDLSANIISPFISKNVNTIYFDKISIDEKKDTVFLLKNIGNAKLKISDIYLDGPHSDQFSINGFTLPIEIDINQEKTFQARFNPTREGYFSSRVNIISNDPLGNENRLVLSGYGILNQKPQIIVSKENLDFGLVQYSKQKELNIFITNQGKGILHIDNAFIDGVSRSSFIIDNNLHNRSLNPKDTILSTVVFTPGISDSLEYYSGEIIVKSNDPINSEKRISLTGYGINKFISLSDTNLNFNNVRIFSTNRRAISIKNNSFYIVKFDSVIMENLVDQPFLVKSVNIPFYIDPNNTYSVDIVFTPVLKKYYSSYFNLFSTNPVKESFKINLIGNTIAPIMKCAPQIIFDKVNIDSTKKANFEIANIGDDYLLIDTISIVGKDSLEFTLENRSFPIKINTNGKTDLDVVVKPKAIGKKDAKIIIISKDINSIENIPILCEINGTTKINENEKPNEIVFQNYPNPFNPSTVISYQLAVNSFVILKIYDILGKEIVTLVNEKQTIGIHNISWEPKSGHGKFPNGIYFCKLSLNGKNYFKKMLFLK